MKEAVKLSPPDGTVMSCFVLYVRMYQRIGWLCMHGFTWLVRDITTTAYTYTVRKEKKCRGETQLLYTVKLISTLEFPNSLSTGLQGKLVTLVSILTYCGSKFRFKNPPTSQTSKQSRGVSVITILQILERTHFPINTENLRLDQDLNPNLFAVAG